MLNIDFYKDFKILYNFQDSLTLRIAEAIHIKNTNPFINVKYNELFDFLSLFKAVIRKSFKGSGLGGLNLEKI